MVEDRLRGHFDYLVGKAAIYTILAGPRGNVKGR
jgi:hypothetical protein